MAPQNSQLLSVCVVCVCVTISLFVLSGQFQDFSLLEVNVDDAIQYGHRLAAHSRASVFFMETSLLTDGETDIEILNSQSGTKYLHSLLPCSAAVAAACVSSVLRETGESPCASNATLQWFIKYSTLQY